MTRKKVKLAYITHDSARKATFKKRKKGLMKKVSELSTLCGIDACVIIYSPYDSQPEVWPSSIGVQNILAQLKNMPEMEQSKKMMNQETFLRQRISKANEHSKKQRKENREKEVAEVMYQGLTGRISLATLNMIDLNDLGWLIDQNLKKICKHFETLNKQPINNNISQVVATIVTPPPPPPPLTPSEVVVPSGGDFERLQNINFEVMNTNNMDAMHKQQWMMDWLNQQEQMAGFVGDENEMLPFGSNINQNSLWSNEFFP